MITIRNQATRRTMMYSRGERLADFCPTQTCLRCATGGDFHEHAPGALSLVREHEKKVRPSSIANRLGEVVISHHAFDVQIFDRNQAVLINDLARLFVMKVAALIADMIVETLKQKSRLTPAVGSFLSSRYAPLQSAQLRVSGSEPARVFDSGTVAQRGERGQAYVNPGHVGLKRQGFWFAFDGEDGKPAARFALHRERLDLPVERAMQRNADPSNLGKPQLIPNKNAANLPKSDAVVSPRGSEARIAWIAAHLYTIKERLECEINALQNVLKRPAIDVGDVGPNRSNLFQLVILIEPSQVFTLIFPCVTPFLKCGIVKLGANAEMRFQRAHLFSGWVNPVAKGSMHECLILSRITV